MLDDDTIRAYLAETLSPIEMARVEKALRDSAELRQRLEHVRAERADPALHSLGAIWRRARLTCVTREQLGSYLLEVLEPDQAAYIKFHVEVVDCPFCRANLHDLAAKSQPTTSADTARRRRIFDSGRNLLSGDQRS